MAARRLRTLIASPGIMQMPCCFDALSAKLVQKAGYPITFASGFSISAAHGLPDTGLMSFGEMEAAMRQITNGLSIPCIGDGDTGYGNAVNVKRTVRGYTRAGLAGIMIEDQVAPKRCGHTKEKAVVDRGTAVMRVRAAVDAAREAAAEGADPIVIVARTDARATHGLEEAISRAKLFRENGADWRFVEGRPLIASDRL
jgi:2-methylisocitrate lyase-like PEP mutase family enzyme